MGVYLREKELEKGMISFYLDIYHNKTRWYEFLEIKINRKHPSEQDKEKRRLANEIRSKRESELIVTDNGLIDRNKRKADFVKWFENYIIAKSQNNTHNAATLAKLKDYMGKKPLPFVAITPVWIKGFTAYLLTKVANNTAYCYLMDLFTGLEDAVREDIIPANPFRKIPPHERIKIQDTFRKAYTLEELELLMLTPFKWNPQIKQAYIFSCFSGMRWSDVNCLKWSEIIRKKVGDEVQYFVYFEQEKTEDIEYLPLSEQAIEIIQEREQAAKHEIKSPYVFPAIKEPDETKKKMWNRVDRALKSWAKKAGMNKKEMSFHTARHTFATNVLEHSEDGDLWTVSKLLGHKSISSTQIYAKVRDRKKTAAVKSLPKLNIKPMEKVA